MWRDWRRPLGNYNFLFCILYLNACWKYSTTQWSSAISAHRKCRLCPIQRLISTLCAPRICTPHLLSPQSLSVNIWGTTSVTQRADERVGDPPQGTSMSLEWSMRCFYVGVHSGIVQCLEILGKLVRRTWFFCLSLYCQLILGFFWVFIVCLLFLAIFYCVKYSIVCSRVFVETCRKSYYQHLVEIVTTQPYTAFWMFFF